uniref:Neur_chan_LBD domain-containing protein n=1 Tax=Syphacia muris TaxID=451379 RepID=A0A0N5AIJ1_9BILA
MGYGWCSEEEERLMTDLFRGYNSLIQPIRNSTDYPLLVKMTVQLVYIINVDEKNQIMHTNVWLTIVSFVYFLSQSCNVYKWDDFQMKWNPVNYGGIKDIRVAPEKVWLPDIVLFNNADGNYEVSFMSNVVIKHTGEMLWVPPAIYKSSCIIDVEFFPFDEQQCHLVFGSWTYSEKEITMGFVEGEYVDTSEYMLSSIWDLIDAPASLVKNRSWIEYQVRIRRKTLFYTVVLIIPTVLMAFLSMAVFYLPTDSGEKMTLTISVLLSIVVFLLLVSKILPPTSSTIPLMAKYLLLTFVLNVITILVTVVIINVYFRGPTTHRMPPWVRRIFLHVMPKFLCLQRPKQTLRKLMHANGKSTAKNSTKMQHFMLDPAVHHPFCPSAEENRNRPPTIELTHVDSVQELIRDPTTSSFYPLSQEAVRAIDAIEYITDHLKQNEEFKMQRDDWKYVAMVIDRFLLYVFAGITIGGTVGILGSAPYILQSVDQKKILTELRTLYSAKDF